MTPVMKVHEHVFKMMKHLNQAKFAGLEISEGNLSRYHNWITN